MYTDITRVLHKYTKEDNKRVFPDQYPENKTGQVFKFLGFDLCSYTKNKKVVKRVGQTDKATLPLLNS